MSSEVKSNHGKRCARRLQAKWGDDLRKMAAKSYIRVVKTRVANMIAF